VQEEKQRTVGWWECNEKERREEREEVGGK
jgi:hypothetical protein